MNTAYLFRVGPLAFILNVQSSLIGYSYPRIFIGFPDNSYLNLDLSLGVFFPMSQNDWDSWYDDELVRLDDIEAVNEKMYEAGINWPQLEKVVFELYKKHK